MNRIGKALRQFEIRRGGFTPHQIRIRCIGQTTADRLLNTRMRTVEPFAGTFAGDELAVVWVAVRRYQIGCVSISTRNNQRRNAHDVGRQTGRHQFLNSFLSRHQNFAAHVTTFFHRCELIFEVNGRCTSLNHRFHQFKRVQDAAKTRFRIGDDRQEVIDIARIVRFNTG